MCLRTPKLAQLNCYVVHHKFQVSTGHWRSRALSNHPNLANTLRPPIPLYNVEKITMVSTSLPSKEQEHKLRPPESSLTF
jgi:hypothetical protein